MSTRSRKVLGAMTQRECLQHELTHANKAITDAGALITEDDGFQWVDGAKLPDTFMAYYSGLMSTGYALGAW